MKGTKQIYFCRSEVRALLVYRGKSVILLSSQRFYEAVSTVTYRMFPVFRRALAGRDAADQASCCGCKWLHLIAWLRPLASVCELYNLRKCPLCFTNLKCSFNFLMDVPWPKTLSKTTRNLIIHGIEESLKYSHPCGKT